MVIHMKKKYLSRQSSDLKNEMCCISHICVEILKGDNIY